MNGCVCVYVLYIHPYANQTPTQTKRHPHSPFHPSTHPQQTQGKIKEGVFAFYLGADSPGELVIGGVDHDRYEGELHYTPLKVQYLFVYLSMYIYI